jgi:RNA polymerase sigma-70 factor (ECF subfamily)
MTAADDEWCRRIHERLLAGDPTASADLAEKVGDVVFEKLSKKYARRDPDMVRDAAWDAIRAYMEHPATFDPGKRGLIGYLVMSADGDLRNALAKVRRRRENLVEDVELAGVRGKRRGQVRVGRAEEKLVAHLEVERLRPQLRRLFSNPADQAALELLVDGERSTEAFAEVWGLGNLPVDQQRSEVKRGKDRLKKALERFGEGLQEGKE